MKKGLFPGSFDPFTKGHEAIVLKAINLFDEIIIGIGISIAWIFWQGHGMLSGLLVLISKANRPCHVPACRGAWRATKNCPFSVMKTAIRATSPAAVNPA